MLLLDEPLGALDRKLRHEMQIELKQIQREVGITFVYVTHDQEEALTMSDVIVVMRDGRIQQQGRPRRSTERPVNRFVAGFIGSSNFIDATLAGRRRRAGRARSRRPRPDLPRSAHRRRRSPPTGDRVTIAIRPESVQLDAPASTPRTAAPGRTSAPGKVAQGTYLGDQTEYRVDVPASAS